MTAILACTPDNNRRGYAGKKISICSDSQVALKTLEGCKDKTGLVKDCRTALRVLAQRNKLLLMWVPEHGDVKGNKRADELAKTGLARPINSPEPAVGIARSCQVKMEIRKWLMDQHHT